MAGTPTQAVGSWVGAVLRGGYRADEASSTRDLIWGWQKIKDVAASLEEAGAVLLLWMRGPESGWGE